MRVRFLIPACAAAASLAAAAATAAPTPPQIVQKQAEAQRVLAQIREIDSKLDHVVDSFNGARIRLGAVDRELGANRQRLGLARRGYVVAQRRVAQRLVELYQSDQPSSVEVLLGARDFGELVDRVESVSAISAQDRQLADAATTLRGELRARRQKLAEQRREQARTVAELSQTRATIEGTLGERRKLLGRVEGEVARLQAEERVRQARLAAEARRRWAAEQQRLAAQRRAAEEARRRQEAAEAAQAARVRAQERAREEAAARRAQEAAAAAAATAATAAVEAPSVTAEPATTAEAPPPEPAATAAAPEPATTAEAAPPPEPATTAEAAPPPEPATTAEPAPPPEPATTAEVPPPAPAAGGHPEAVGIALRYLGTPYRYGGASPSTGFDCSGFIMYVYAQLGITLPHNAAAQYGVGVPVERSQLVPGDLVFFDGLGHNGIYIGGGQFVHSPRTGDVVKISSLDEDWYASRWVGARRVA